MNTNATSIRVLVVDDSVVTRNTIATMLMKYSDVQVVGAAKNGTEAIEQIKHLQPDVMTLDVDMPGMNGLEVLDYVMHRHPLPVIMISASTKEGARVTLQALERGAVDFIPKEVCSHPHDLQVMGEKLHRTIQAAYQSRKKLQQVRPFPRQKENIRMEGKPLGKPDARRYPIVIIGSSTGGPNVVKILVQEFPVHFSASLVIIQHMPKFFTKVFSESLNAIASFPIREACEGDYLEPGVGFVAPGDQHLFIHRDADGRAVITLSAEPEAFPYRPSVDGAMISAAKYFESMVIGVVISGMGNDGARGCQTIKEYGGTVLVQNEATALMYGMPRAVIETGCADAVVSERQLSHYLIQWITHIEEERGWSIPVEHLSSPNNQESH